MSSYVPPADEGIITREQFRESMRLVQLQTAVPISAGINALFPTLLSPNSLMVGLYWAVFYVLRFGFCLTLLLVRKQVTKDTLIHGVGLRFAITNCIQAAWAVCFTLQFFIGSEILLILNVINLISIQATLRFYPLTLKRPMDAIFIHAPMVLLLAILFEIDWLHNGFIALGWVISDEYRWDKWTWEAVGSVGAVNVVTAIWEGVARQHLMTVASEYLLLTLFFSSPRTKPTLPSTALPKPTPLLVVLIIALVLHPIAIITGVAWQRTREREGRIRLEEEVEAVEEEEREAEAHARAVERA